MSADDQAPVAYADFLTADPRRRGDALELGHDFTDEQGNRYRACWYAETTEMTIELIPDFDALEVDDFHAGIATAEVVGRFDRHELEDRLGPWPQLTRCWPRTVRRLRELASA